MTADNPYYSMGDLRREREAETFRRERLNQWADSGPPRCMMRGAAGSQCPNVARFEAKSFWPRSQQRRVADVDGDTVEVCGQCLPVACEMAYGAVSVTMIKKKSSGPIV